MSKKSPIKDFFKSKNTSTSLPVLNIPSSESLQQSGRNLSPRCPISSCRRFLSKDNPKCRCVYEAYYKNLPPALQAMVSDAGNDVSFTNTLKKPVIMKAIRSNRKSNINENDEIEIFQVFYNFEGEGFNLRTKEITKFNLSVFMPHDHSSIGEDELHPNILNIIIKMKSLGISKQMLTFPLLVRSFYNYSPTTNDEMSIQDGDYIILESLTDDLWGQGFKLSKKDGHLLVQSRVILNVPLSILTDPIDIKYETVFIKTLPKHVQSALFTSYISPLGFAGLLTYMDEAIIEKSKLPNDNLLNSDAQFVFVFLQGVFDNGLALVEYTINSINRVHNVKLSDLHFFES